MYENVCYTTYQLVNLKKSFNFYNKKMKPSIATITKANIVKKKETSHINVFWSVGETDVLYIRITRLSSVLGGYIQERFFSI